MERILKLNLWVIFGDVIDVIKDSWEGWRSSTET